MKINNNSSNAMYMAEPIVLPNTLIIILIYFSPLITLVTLNILNILNTLNADIPLVFSLNRKNSSNEKTTRMASNRFIVSLK